MASKSIFGFLSFLDKEGKVVQQDGNIAFRMQAKLRTIWRWNNNTPGSASQLKGQPWKQVSLLADDDITVGHGLFWSQGNNYPEDPGPSQGAVSYGNVYYPAFRTSAVAGTVASSTISRVFGSVAATVQSSNSIVYDWLRGDVVISMVDVPRDYTQIGNVWPHPATQLGVGTPVSTAAGTNYVTYANGSYFDNTFVGGPPSYNLIRIETGADAGYYFIHNNDYLNNRLYLQTLSGQKFNALATASGLTVTLCSGRRAWFNETSIIQLSTGLMDTGGRFNPRKDDPAVRSSFILRATFDKTGSTEAATGTEQQGSYFLSTVAYTHGEGVPLTAQGDRGTLFNTYFNTANGVPAWFNFFQGGINGMALDWPNQRLWFGYTDASNNSGIAHWRWKTGEGLREVANNLGTAAQASFLSPTPVLGAGDVIADAETGSLTGSAGGWVYFTIGNASGGNAGVLIIKPNLTTSQYNISLGGFGATASQISGCSLDKSRTRVGVTGNFVTVAGAGGNCTATLGDFTQADVGRVLALTGGSADNGTYKISTVTTATSIAVTTLAGADPGFSGGTGGTFEIGDRLYLFFGNTSQNNAINAAGGGKMTYMESMAPGTFLQRSVTLTTAANIRTRTIGGTALRFGQPELCSIDPATGNVYWLSDDGGTHQINKYDVTANSHSLRTIANVQTPSGGTGTLGTITQFTAIKVNTKFDHIWVGTNVGHVRLVKSDFAGANYKRYYGGFDTTYENPAGFIRSQGTGSPSIGTAGSFFVRGYSEHPDGRMTCRAADASNGNTDWGSYSQEQDNWRYIENINSSNGNEFWNEIHDPYGTFLMGYPSANTSRFWLGQYELQYQWDAGNSKWIPLEVVQAVTPDKGIPATNGSTTIGSSTFTGSNFLSTHAGQLLRIESGADAGIYRVAAFLTSTTVTLARLDGTAFSATATAGTLSWSLNPGCMTRPIHSTLQDSLYGVKVRFNRQGGATPANNEFLGRAGLARATITDGQTLTPNLFTGTGFVVGDIGKLLRVEAGGVAPLTAAEYTVYKITAFSAPNITVTKMDGSAVTWSSFTTSITASVWDLASPGLNAGPENITVMLADGFGKDNTTDITGMTYDHYNFKTRLHEHDEARKFTVDVPIAAPGSLASGLYWETYPRNGANFEPAVSHHRALPAAELANGRQALDFAVDKYLDGTGNRATALTPDNNWVGTGISNRVNGASVMLDFGKDVQVGYVQLRALCNLNPAYIVATNTYSGLIGNLYKASDTSVAATPVPTFTPPANSATVRTSGTTFSISGVDVKTATVSTGDFLGSVTTGPFTNGAIITGQSTFVAPAATFVPADFMKVLHITVGAGADIGPYRIIAVSGDGSTVTVRNLDQTAKAWTVSASGLTYSVKDGVREEDMITVGVAGNGNGTTGLTFSSPNVTLNSSGTPFVSGMVGQYIQITGATNPANNGVFLVTVFNSTSSITYSNPAGVTQSNYAGAFNVFSQRLCVERITDNVLGKTLQLRVGPSSIVSSVNWQAFVPSWTPVKRLSHNTEAVPPDVKANGTWASLNGREQQNNSDFKLYFDLTDLPAAQRTGRWWKFSGMPRWETDPGSPRWWLSTFEFYDTAGNRLAVSKYTSTDQFQTNPDFFFQYVNRVDFIQAANDALTGVSGFNGTVDLGGANGDTLTLTTGGNKFLGFQVRVPYTDGSTTGPDKLNSTAAVFTTADVGRFVRVTSGTFSGNYYRIASRVSATQVALLALDGSASGITTDAGPFNFTIHEGFNVGGTTPDKIALRRLGSAGDVVTTVATNQLNSASGAFTLGDIGKSIRITGATQDNGTYIVLRYVSPTQVTVTTPQGVAVSFAGGTGGTFEVDSDLREYTIATVNSGLTGATTLTINESLQAARTGVQWEIRRSGYNPTANFLTTDPSKTARALTHSSQTYPVQSGDVWFDSRGTVRFFSEDVGSGCLRTDGSAPGGSNVFNGSGFCPDDVGRLFYYATTTAAAGAANANLGIYEVASYVSATQITLKNHYTGGAVTLIADTTGSAVNYKIFGDRRFRVAKYVTGLRA